VSDPTGRINRLARLNEQVRGSDHDPCNEREYGRSEQNLERKLALPDQPSTLAPTCRPARLTCCWQINYEDRQSRQWLGVVLIDRNIDAVDEDEAVEIIGELKAAGLTPADGRWLVHFRRLPADADIPDTIKNRLITNANETAPHGFVMVSEHGAN
jgi:hypothetical protein